MAQRPQSGSGLYSNVPLPDEDEHDSFLSPPAPHLLQAYPGVNESPRDSFLVATPPNDSGMLLGAKSERYAEEDFSAEKPEKRRPRWILVALAIFALIVVILAIVLPIVFTVAKPKNHKSLSSTPSSTRTTSRPAATASPTSSPGSSTPPVLAAITGGDGSTVIASDGSTFTYSNSFGGIWFSDPNNPYNNAAFPNSWTPPLNQSWDYDVNRIYGVNLGGWFVLEPFITPALYQKYPGAVDEWTLSTLMAADTANGGLSQIEDHYKTFVTEQDIAQIAGAGLNWIRLPIPFWAIDTWGNEPFLAKTSWKYIVQALQWCRKYGIRVKLDLHTIPGSQNGFNHSGKLGQVNFLMGVMGMANAQRALNYIRIITEFISQPEWRDVVPVFGIMNEALIKSIGDTELRGFYLEAYEMIRGITGVGQGHGPFISIHDGFEGLNNWAGFLSGSDRIALDTHPYFAFDGSPATDPIDTGTGPDAGGTWPQAACNRWASELNTSRSAFGVTFAGEFSNGFNDCGLFLLGVNGNKPAFGGNCDDWQDSSNWTPGAKAGVQAFAEASMDALRDWFFWTWKIGPSNTGVIESPLWSYQLGLEQGWMPADPRVAIGKCGASTGPVFDGTFESWMTGGANAGTIASDQTASYPWPPTELQSTDIAPLPVYTSTGSIATLPPPAFTDTSGNSISGGDGWFNVNDDAPGPAPIPGCSYPDPWNALDVPVPTGCTGGANAALPAVITPPPSRR